MALGSSPFRKIITGSTLLVLIFIVAVCGYVAEGWAVGDSIYMVIITIFGVGYGEVKPIESVRLRVLTIMVIVSGYLTMIYTVGGGMQLLIDGELNKVLGARRMTKGIDGLSNHTIICGIGRLGTNLAKELHAAGKPFIAIDSDLQKLQGLEEKGYLVLHGDASEEGVLEQAGIMRASTVAAVMSTDATNVFVTITARELNPDVIIFARGENPRTEKKLLGCGASRVILPTAIGAHKFAQLIIRPTSERLLEGISSSMTMIEELGQLGLQINEVHVNEGTQLVNQPIRQVEMQSDRGLLIVGIRKTDGTSTLNPSPDTILEAGDILIMLGHSNDVATLRKKLSTKSYKMVLRGVKING